MDWVAEGRAKPVRLRTASERLRTTNEPWHLLDPPRPDVASEPLPWIGLQFTVDQDVLPGQQIPITWQIWSYNIALDLGSLTAGIFLLSGSKEQRIYESPDPVPYKVAKNGSGDSGSQVAAIEPADPILAADQALTNELYRIGTKTLRLEVTGTGKDKGPYTMEASLNVLPEAVTSSWWQWTSPTSGAEYDTEWKRGYTLAATFTNRSTIAQLQGSATLYEVDVSANTTVARGSVPIAVGQGLVPPSTPVDVSFQEIKQDWQWLIPVVWVQFAPSGQRLTTIKGFWYTARFTLTDQYGNSYKDLRSPVLNVSVEVSLAKRAAAAAALSSLAFAAATIYMPLVSGPAFSSAQAFGASALDPPEPNPRYREPVFIVPAPLPQGLTEDTQLASIAFTFELINRVIASLGALSDIHGRLLGARLAGDRAAARMHTNAYRKGLRYMSSATFNLVKSATEAVQTLRRDPRLSNSTARKAITKMRRQGIPPDLRRQARSAGIPPRAIAQLGVALRDQVVAKQAATGVSRNLELMVVAVLRLAYAVHRETPAILKGRPKDRRM